MSGYYKQDEIVLTIKKGCRIYEEMKKKNPKKLFPIGSRVYIDYISDGSYPTAVGQCGIVRLVDDAGQVHLRMEDGSSATVCLTYGDRFFRLTEK